MRSGVDCREHTKRTFIMADLLPQVRRPDAMPPPEKASNII